MISNYSKSKVVLGGFYKVGNKKGLFSGVLHMNFSSYNEIFSTLYPPS